MGSDEDYMAFLDKANEDPSAGRAKQASAPGGGAQLKAQDNGVEVPEAIAAQLKGGDKIYVSEADEPFEGVALSWSKGLPDEGRFCSFVYTNRTMRMLMQECSTIRRASRAPRAERRGG